MFVEEDYGPYPWNYDSCYYGGWHVSVCTAAKVWSTLHFKVNLPALQKSLLLPLDSRRHPNFPTLQKQQTLKMSLLQSGIDF